jgi:hypothetical protein
MTDGLYARCSACGEPRLCRSQDIYPDNGWVLPYETFGYYGGFSDSMRVLLGQQRSSEWILCHDCVVKFLRTFPALADSFGNGHHPCSDDSPCCEFAWRGTENFAKKHGEMLVRTQTAVRSDDGIMWWQDDAPEA